MKNIKLKVVKEGKELFLKAHAIIQIAKRDANVAASKTIESISSNKEEKKKLFDDIMKAMDDNGTNSKEVFEFLYEFVENSEMVVSEKYKKCQWKHKVTGDKMIQYIQ